MKSAELNFR